MRCQIGNGNDKNASSAQSKNARKSTVWESTAITESFQWRNYNMSLAKEELQR